MLIFQVGEQHYSMLELEHLLFGLFVVEILAIIFSAFSVYFTYRSNRYCWPVGFIGIIFYFSIFYSNRDWINMSLQVVFGIQSIVGWINWSDGKIVTSFLKNKFLLLLVFPLWGILYCISILATGSDAILDSLTSSLSLFAIYLMSCRKIESWILWAICDIFLIFLFIDNELYLSSCLYFVFLVMSILGFFKWRSLLNEEV